MDIVALDVRGISLLADYFVICSGNTDRRILAIVDEVIEQAEKAQIPVRRVEGKDAAKWVLIDLGDVIVHVFNQAEREFYQLEKLWSDAPFVNLEKWVVNNNGL